MVVGFSKPDRAFLFRKFGLGSIVELGSQFAFSGNVTLPPNLSMVFNPLGIGSVLDVLVLGGVNAALVLILSFELFCDGFNR